MWIDDQILERHQEALAIKIFVPEKRLVVLGSGNQIAQEVHGEYCREHLIPVTRRYGGGGTVVLYNGCVVVTIGAWMRDAFSNSQYFKLMNQAVIDALGETWPRLKNLSQAGISDIVMDGKKVAGTSLFRSRNYLLYQCSLLVSLDHQLIAGCLQHPSKEPDYRQGRRHQDFLAGLFDLEPEVQDSRRVAEALQHTLAQHLIRLGASELVEPKPEQMRSLRDRLARAAELPV